MPCFMTIRVPIGLKSLEEVKLAADALGLKYEVLGQELRLHLSKTEHIDLYERGQQVICERLVSDQTLQKLQQGYNIASTKKELLEQGWMVKDSITTKTGAVEYVFTQ